MNLNLYEPEFENMTIGWIIGFITADGNCYPGLNFQVKVKLENKLVLLYG